MDQMQIASLAEPPHYADDYLRDILGQTRVIAMVGASPNWNRPSHFVMKYLQGRGFRVIPVNPVKAGERILGEVCHASLAEAREAAGPDPIDMVDVFRHPREAPDLAHQAVQIGARTLWLQITVISQEAHTIATQAGLNVVMNRCPKIEYQRLHGEIGQIGINSRIISSRKRPLKSFKRFD